jgi:hypothetical protein
MRGTWKYCETTIALCHPFSPIIRDAFLAVRCVVAPPAVDVDATLRHPSLDQIPFHHLCLIEPFDTYPAADDYIGEEPLPIKGDRLVEPGA